jgi:hypothetical protein
MILFHRTDQAEAILHDGFRDAEGTYALIGFTLRGVFLSDVPLDYNQGAKGQQLIEVILPDSIDISDYELVEEGKPYREWCVPAEFINENASLRIVPFDEKFS